MTTTIMILFPEWSVRGQHLERCSVDETSRACPASTTQRLRPEVTKLNTMTRRKPWMNYLQTTVVPPWTDCSYDLLEKWFAENCNQTRVVTTPNQPQLCNGFAHSRKCTVSLSLSQETEAGEICFPKQNENQSPSEILQPLRFHIKCIVLQKG